MGGNCGGIIASYVYLSRSGPRFIIGHCILIGFITYAAFALYLIAYSPPTVWRSASPFSCQHGVISRTHGEIRWRRRWAPEN